MIVNLKLLNLPDCKDLDSYLVKWSISPEVYIEKPIRKLQETLPVNFTIASIYTVTANVFNSYKSKEIQTKIRIPNFIYPPNINAPFSLNINKSQEPTNLNLIASYAYDLLEGQEIIEYEWISNYPNYEQYIGNEFKIPITLQKGEYNFWFKCRVKDNIGNISEWTTHLINIIVTGGLGKFNFQFDSFNSLIKNINGIENNDEIIVVKQNIGHRKWFK